MSACAKPFTLGSALTRADVELHLRSGIDQEVLEFAGVRRVDSFDGKALVGARDDADYSGIAYPYFFPGDPDAREFRLRRDHPEMEIGSDGQLKPKNKYLGPPGRRSRVYFAPETELKWLESPSMPIVLTEGEKKTLALHSLAKFGLGDAADRPRWMSIGIPGVWSWRGTVGKTEAEDGHRVDIKGVIPDFGRINWINRKVIIVFDTNVKSNPNVRWARHLLIAELQQRQAEVFTVDIPECAGVNGVDDLIGRWGKAAVLDVIAGSTAQEKQGGTDWEEPISLKAALPTVDKFTSDLLPSVFCEMVDDAAQRMQVPADLIAIPLITALSAVVGRRARIQPKRADSEWQVTPNLWGTIIAPPGFMKSPSQKLGIRPLSELQNASREAYIEEEERYEQETRKWKVSESVWYSRAKKDEEAGRKQENFKVPKPKPPCLERFITNDATQEKLHDLLKSNPAGILYTRDELSGWLAQMDQPGREGERAFFLTAWAGDEAHHVDRIARGTNFVDAMCLSVIGGIQPALFRSYAVSMLQDSVASGKISQNDGLLPRFQLLTWPDMDPSWTYIDRQPNSSVIDQVSNIFRRLSWLDPASPIRMKFDDDAQAMFVGWLSDLETKHLRSSEHHEAFVLHLSKYRSLIPSLAGLFELVEMTAQGRYLQAGQLATITVTSLKRALAWSTYLQSHAKRAYSCIISPEMQAAQTLSERIKERKLGQVTEKSKAGQVQGRFSVRDVYLKGWTGLGNKPSAIAALEILEDARWVRSVEQPDRPHRPREEYDINPRIFEGGF